MLYFDAEIIIFTEEISRAEFWFVRPAQRIHLWEFSRSEWSAPRGIFHKEVKDFFCTISKVFNFKNSLKLRNSKEWVICPGGQCKVSTVLLIFRRNRGGMITVIWSRKNYVERDLSSKEVKRRNEQKNAEKMSAKGHERKRCGFSLNMSEVFNLCAICNSIRLESVVSEEWKFFGNDVILYFLWGRFIADNGSLSKLPLGFVR